MTKFKVSIEETLCRTIEIEAENEEQAEARAKTMYKCEKIVLDANDCYMTQICIENTDTKEITDWHEL